MSRNQQSIWHDLCQNNNVEMLDRTPPPLELFQRKRNTDIELGTEETLRRTQEELLWYRTLYESIPSVYLTLDAAATIVSVNEFGAAHLGYIPEELIQKPVFKLFEPSQHHRLSTALTGLLQRTPPTEVENWEFRLDCAASQILWVKVVARLVQGESQNPVILMVCEDITDHKQAEEALRESEQRFHTMADTAPVMLWTSGTDCLCTFFNQHWLEFTGRSIEEEIGNGWAEGVHPEDINYCLETYSTAFNLRQNFQMEYRLRRADGEYRWILDSGVPRFTPNGSFTGYIGSCIDITEQKLAEVALLQSQKAAQQQVEEIENLNRLKDEFLSTVSHELRTPVTNMKMAIQMLALALNQERDFLAEMAKPPEKRSKVARYFQILHNECEREINLLNNFLDLQRLDTGVKPLVLEAIEIQKWLEKVVEPFKGRTRNFKQQLQLEISPNLPSFVCDSLNLERIVVELLTNACKYTPSGEQIIVRANLKSSNIELQVINYGVEIPAAELAKIFDKFYRVPSNDPWKQGGTGLGLALVQKLTNHLGGTIEVESRSSRTCFTVKLPLQRSEG